MEENYQDNQIMSKSHGVKLGSVEQQEKIEKLRRDII